MVKFPNHPAGRITLALVTMIIGLTAMTQAVAQATSQASGQVTARVDRDRLIEGETLTLILQTNDARQSLDANLSVLEDDFLLLDQRSETQMSITNGRQTAVIRKMVTLEPRRAGRLVIPPLRLGNQVTQPISIQVENAPEPDPGEPQAVFIEVEVNPQQGPYYVHAQVGFTVRLFYQQSLTEAAISQPEPENASVRLLDEVPFQADRAGQRYRVLERHYAMFPERSGSLNIPPVILSGRLVDRGSDRMWQPSRRGRRITVESDPITIDVSPRPAQFSGQDWQPARSYRLGEELSVSGEIRVGEPVTRTVIIDAVGLEENMIAEPEWSEIPDARIYPDQPQGISRDDGKWVLGHKEFRYAVVPEKEGTLVLPEVTVAWWDTTTNQERVSVLPASNINVLPSAASVASALSAENMNVAVQPDGLSVNADEAGRYWRWLTLLFATLWLATLFFAVRFPRRPRPAPETTRELAESELVSGLKKACLAGDAGAARKQLRGWLKRFSPYSGLVDFARQCGSETLAGEVRQLDAAGFSPDADESWHGKALFAAFEQWKRNRKNGRNARDASIVDLYAPENRRVG
ncbi:MAG TPA: BatD family protein [Xanthomonadales bacterium]|nr:BatD family protein [Xanthomonadales bacterium]